MSEVKVFQGDRLTRAVGGTLSRWLDGVVRTWMWHGLCLLLWIAVSPAQVTTITSDGTLGTRVNQNGNVYEITGGAQPAGGANRFHSFNRFDVGTGDIAHFIGGVGIDNIIGRVTGGDMSIIDGVLQSDANLFLLNPQGILFGDHATLNINGSFHASTADVLHFADGFAFSTQPTTPNGLTVASPSAFGFLSEHPAGIQVQGSELSVPAGETLSLVGGDISVAGHGNAEAEIPNLSAPSGRIHMVSVASSGTVAFDPAGQGTALEVGSFEQLGTIGMRGGARVDVSGMGSGTVAIRGGQLLIDQSQVVAHTVGDMDGAEIGVDIEVENEFVLTNGAVVITGTFGPGHGGSVSVRAAEVRLEEETLIFALSQDL